jgi:polyphosphate kinase
VGRFLEHSRIYYFHNDGREEVYLGSADLMTRNIDRRVEVLFPVQDKQLIHRLRNEVLNTYLNDNLKSRRMMRDGTYERLAPSKDKKPLDGQAWLLDHHQDGNQP